MDYTDEFYKVWHVDGVNVDSAKMDIQEILDDCERLSIVLKDLKNGHIFRIIFEGALFYRCLDESYFLRRWGDIRSENRNANLFIIENSSLMNWVDEESDKTFSILHPGAKHFSILTATKCMDILAEGEIFFKKEDQ